MRDFLQLIVSTPELNWVRISINLIHYRNSIPRLLFYFFSFLSSSLNKTEKRVLVLLRGMEIRLLWKISLMAVCVDSFQF